MAGTDLVKVRPQIAETIPGVGATTTNGVEQEVTVAALMSGAAATTTAAGSVLQAAFIAQVTVPFADLTAAATAHNALLTALKNAGIMKPTA